MGILADSLATTNKIYKTQNKTTLSGVVLFSAKSAKMPIKSIEKRKGSKT